MKAIYALLILVAAAAVVVANPPPATYVVVEMASFQAALTNGLNPTVFAQKIRENYGGVKTGLANCLKSVDGKYFLISCRKPSDIAYLRARADDLHIGYTEYGHPEILAVMAGTNWTYGTED